MFTGDMTSEEWFRHNGEPPKYKPKSDVEIRLGTEDDIERLEESLPARKIKKFRRWFKDGNDLFVGLHNGRIVYYQWLMYRDFYDPFAGMVIKLKEDEVLPVDVYTAPDFRFKDIHLAANYMTITRCKELGRHKMVALSTPEKFPLLKLWYKKTGLGHIRPLKHIVYHRLFKFIKLHSVKNIEESRSR